MRFGLHQWSRGLEVFLTALLLSAGSRGGAAPPAQVRFATFNASLNRATFGQLFTDLSAPGSAGAAQAKHIAEIIQRNAPDILLVNEFDWDPATDAQGRTVVELFHDNFLAVPQQAGLPALSYPWRFTAKPNTGFSPMDSNEDGVVTIADTGGVLVDFDNAGGSVTTPGTEAYGNDCFGFGEFRGKYGMVVYSRFPVQPAGVRTFRKFLWKDMPGALLPDDAATPAFPNDWYSPAELAVFRLSSKSHWDIPIDLGGGITVHFLCDHPTPPVFDFTEDRNGRRNHDEIRFWADYIDPALSTYHRDDAGIPGGLPAGARFFIAGDHNADPVKGESIGGAALQFTTHPLINNTFVPSAAAYSNNTTNTADFSPDLRVDYVLPSRAGFNILTGAVFWPVLPDLLAPLVTTANASDHKLVWLDVQPAPSIEEAVRSLTTKLESARIVLTFKAAPGYTYQLQESPVLTAGAWIDVPGAPVNLQPDLSASASVAVSVPGRRFFRIAASFAP